MAQTLRPDSTVTQGSWAGQDAGTSLHTYVDEVSASDADYLMSADNVNTTCELGLADPGSTPNSGTCTVRYRWAAGRTGKSLTLQAHLYEGATLRQSGTAHSTPATSFVDASFTFTYGDISDWTDLRLRFTTSNNGGGGQDGRISWTEVEVPDGAVVETIVGADSDHGHAADGSTLLQAHDLTVAESAHGHAADGSTLVQAHDLTVAGADHAHSVDNVGVSETTDIPVAGTAHAHAADGSTIVQQHTLAIDESAHAHSADNVATGQHFTLEVADSTHSHSVDGTTLPLQYTQSPDESSHAHVAGNVVVSSATWEDPHWRRRVGAYR